MVIRIYGQSACLLQISLRSPRNRTRVARYWVDQRLLIKRDGILSNLFIIWAQIKHYSFICVQYANMTYHLCLRLLHQHDIFSWELGRPPSQNNESKPMTSQWQFICRQGHLRIEATNSIVSWRKKTICVGSDRYRHVANFVSSVWKQVINASQPPNWPTVSGQYSMEWFD